jgi:cell division inhibitor SulA/protein ImuA
MSINRQAELQEMLSRGMVWRGAVSEQGVLPGIASGFPELDEQIGDGWPRGALTEILSQQGQGLSLLFPLLGKLSHGQQWLAWVNSPYLPYAPALAARQVDVSRLLLIRAKDDPQSLWAAEQALRSGNCALVMLWIKRLSSGHIRRLQLAAEESDSMAILFRPQQHCQQSSVAALRLEVMPSENGMTVKILKRRSGWGGKTLHLSCSG